MVTQHTTYKHKSARVLLHGLPALHVCDKPTGRSFWRSAEPLTHPQNFERLTQSSTIYKILPIFTSLSPRVPLVEAPSNHIFPNESIDTYSQSTSRRTPSPDGPQKPSDTDFVRV